MRSKLTVKLNELLAHYEEKFGHKPPRGEMLFDLGSEIQQIVSDAQEQDSLISDEAYVVRCSAYEYGMEELMQFHGWVDEHGYQWLEGGLLTNRYW